MKMKCREVNASIRFKKAIKIEKELIINCVSFGGILLTLAERGDGESNISFSFSFLAFSD